MGLTLLLGCLLLINSLALAGFDVGELSLPGFLKGSGLYMAALESALPGLRSLQGEPGVPPLGMVNQTLLALVDVNPLDPKTFLANQISGMRSFTGYSPPPGLAGEGDPPPEAYPALLTQDETYQGGDLHGGIFIYHAHTTESFFPTSGERFTSDLTQTVAFLGQELKLLLEGDYGIPVLHDVTIHDIPRSQAYQEARVTAGKRIAAAPEIRLVLDIHRDGVPRRVSTAEINGQEVGKILLVMGTAHEGAEENMARARAFHEALERIAPGISRGIRERSLVYNQDLHPGALLVEVGGHENTLEEARRTLPYLAQALAEVLYQIP